MEKYEIWFTIRVSHEYYENENCPILIEPSGETRDFLQRNKIIYKKRARNQWVLLAQFENFSPEINNALFFEIIPKDNMFYYVTEQSSKKNNDNYTLESNPNAGKWMNLLIYVDNIKEEVDIKFNSKSKYWEFVIIPRHISNTSTLKIEEKRKTIKFGNIEETQFPGVEKAFRVSTKEKNKLNNKSNYVIRLYEVRENGERLLSRYIPLPHPDSFSITQPNDTITTYFYI